MEKKLLKCLQYESLVKTVIVLLDKPFNPIHTGQSEWLKYVVKSN